MGVPRRDGKTRPLSSQSARRPPVRPSASPCARTEPCCRREATGRSARNVGLGTDEPQRSPDPLKRPRDFPRGALDAATGAGPALGAVHLTALTVAGPAADKGDVLPPQAEAERQDVQRVEPFVAGRLEDIARLVDCEPAVHLVLGRTDLHELGHISRDDLLADGRLQRVAKHGVNRLDQRIGRPVAWSRWAGAGSGDGAGRGGRWRGAGRAGRRSGPGRRETRRPMMRRSVRRGRRAGLWCGRLDRSLPCCRYWPTVPRWCATPGTARRSGQPSSTSHRARPRRPSSVSGAYGGCPYGIRQAARAAGLREGW